VAGIETVIVGATDPNPQVGGKGLHALRKSGMEVVECPLDGTIPEFYAGFGHFLATGRPRVTVKVAVSSEGNLAAAPGQRTAITGEATRRFVHSLRAQSDAILIGGRTALADDPELTVRDAPGRSPHRLVLWPTAGLPNTLKLWTNKAPVTVFGTSERPPDLPALAKWVRLPAGPDNKLDLAKLIEWCGSQGIHELLVEPGQNLLETILACGLWNGLWIVRSKTSLPNGVAADPKRRFPTNPSTIQRQFGEDTGNFWENYQKPSLSPLS
jgi:diaminohydroxyphosphoribosylaminopyrimidine deaminase/5-amino-6-(5-phosphoribosylamino)uracil reductase